MKMLFSHMTTKYEVELIKPEGSYWGDLTIIDLDDKSFLYFRSNWKKLDEQEPLNEIKYNFRSMYEGQNDNLVELLINTKDIEEIMTKNFLWNPIAIEIFDSKHNRLYFFSFFWEDMRLHFW